MWGSLDVGYVIERMATKDLQPHPDSPPTYVVALGVEPVPRSAAKYGLVFGAPKVTGDWVGSQESSSSSSERSSSEFLSRVSTPASLVESDPFVGGAGEKQQVPEAFSPAKNAEIEALIQGEHKTVVMPLMTMCYRVYESMMMMG